MKLRTHHLILFFSLMVVLPLTAQPAYSQSLTAITESDIQAMVASVDKAARKGNVAGMIAPFAPDIRIKMTVVNPKNNKEKVGTLTKEQFAFNARQTFRRKLAYDFERKNMRIKIYDAETAMVSSEIYETIKLPQGTIRGASSEYVFVKLREGKLVITGIEARMRVY